MNITRSTRKSKIKNLAKIGSLRKKLTLSIVSVLSCVSLLFVSAVATNVDPTVDIDNPITYTSDIAFEKNPNPNQIEFYIRSYQDLQVLANLVSANAVITGTNISYSSATYTVMNNITNDSGEFMNPIGTSDNPFTGTFNGNGYTISDLKIEGFAGVGLFGVTDGATITGVRIESGLVTATGDKVGGIVGAATNTTITGSYNKATVYGDCSSWVGGLVGVLTNSNISDSANLGDVSGINNVGGLVGEVVTNSGDYEIANCFNAGNISSGTFVGGLVGSATGSETHQATIKSAYSVAKVASDADVIVGGYTNLTLSGVYYLTDMGGLNSAGAVGLTGEYMSGIDAISNAKLSGLDPSHWEAVENGDGVYNLPILEAINIGATLYKITYDLNNGIIHEEDEYTKYFKINDEITLPQPYRAGFSFTVWVNESNEITKAEDIKGVGKSVSLTATWAILTPNVTIVDSKTDHKRVYGESSSLTVNYIKYDGINYDVRWTLGDATVGTEDRYSFSAENLPALYTYKVTVTATCGEYSSSASAEVTVEILKKNLIVLANDIDVTYGSPEEEFLDKLSVTYDGFVYGDNTTMLDGTLAFTIKNGTHVIENADLSKQLVGSYTIVPSGYSSNYYDFTYMSGTLKITERNLTITAGSTSKIYDGNELVYHNFTAPTVNDDTVSGVVFTAASKITDVGRTDNEIDQVNSAIVIKNTAGEDVTDCYNISFAKGQLEITPRDIEIQVTGYLTYGESTPRYEYVISSTGGGYDDIQGALRTEIIKLIEEIQISDGEGNVIESSQFSTILVSEYNISFSASSDN